jgi:hypothetical protein
VFRTLGRGVLALVFAGLGYAVLHRRNVTQPPPAGDGWVELHFDS